MTTTTARRAKKNLKEDQLVTTTFRLTEWAQAHFNQVIIGVVALVAVVAILGVRRQQPRERRASRPRREMGSALTLMDQGEYATAKGSFQQVADHFGGAQGAAARFFKAECELHENDYKAAADDYDTYLARVKDYPMFEASALMGKALALEGLQNYTEAANSMAAAVDKLDPKDPRHFDAAYNAGAFYERAGRTADALKYFEMVGQGRHG
jgi:tetratricopeptide (TPR) repeat protein